MPSRAIASGSVADSGTAAYWPSTTSTHMGEAKCLQELRGIGLGGYEVPEWKTKALGKAPTFGFSDVRPIKEQRESLPIFKLRDQLIEAITVHQVCASMPLAAFDFERQYVTCTAHSQLPGNSNSIWGVEESYSGRAHPCTCLMNARSFASCSRILYCLQGRAGIVHLSS